MKNQNTSESSSSNLMAGNSSGGSGGKKRVYHHSKPSPQAQKIQKIMEAFNKYIFLITDFYSEDSIDENSLYELKKYKKRLERLLILNKSYIDDLETKNNTISRRIGDITATIAQQEHFNDSDEYARSKIARLQDKH